MPTTDMFSNILSHFQQIFIGGVGKLEGPALKIFGILLLIDLVLAVLLNIGEVDNIKLLVKKTLKYGLVYFVILNYGYLLDVIFKGFTWIGIEAGKGSVLTDPSVLTEHGFRIAGGILNKVPSVVSFANPVTASQYAVIGFLVLLCFGIVAINILVTYLEFYMISILSLMLIPFGSNKYTSFITQKVINAIISLGVKLMVLAFIVSASLPMIKLWSTPSNVGLEDSLYILLGSAALAFLSWHAPNLASSLMSGMPSLNASSIISPAISTANSAVVTAATMGAGAPAAIAAAGGSSAGSAVKAATKTTS
jgi:type IV secretion system protein TrbL